MAASAAVGAAARIPKGFVAAGVSVGIKKKPNVLDMAVIASKTPCSAAAVFTQNCFQAAPVRVSRQLLSSLGNRDVSAVVINSGCANACTSDRGLADAQATVELMRKHGFGNSLVMSTGVIGPFLPMAKITQGIKQLANVARPDGFVDASRAIMTTDTVPKLHSAEYALSGSTISMAGVAKGAGMIHPNVATMLSVIVTDAKVDPKALQAALSHAADRSFNAISIDGDSSTNDSVAVLANGTAGGPEITVDSPHFGAFQSALVDMTGRLAKHLVRDGEGATKFVTVRVDGARSYAEAKQVANSISRSSLFKTAMYGQDANWGRVLCAVGYSGVPIEPSTVSLFFGEGETCERPLEIVRNGTPFDTNEERASAILRGKDITVRVDLGQGSHSAQMWTCDFSIDYVKINADYRS